jgi:hypothetical protein
VTGGSLRVQAPNRGMNSLTPPTHRQLNDRRDIRLRGNASTPDQ